MSKQLLPLLAGVAVLALMRKRAEPTAEPDKKVEPKPQPKPDAKPDSNGGMNADPESKPDPEPEAVQKLEPGQYDAKEGETVMLDMAIPGVSPILGIKATRDGEQIENVYSGLIAGFELAFRLDGIEVTLIQPGAYEISTIPVIVNEDFTVNYEESAQMASVWGFAVDGVANA